MKKLAFICMALLLTTSSRTFGQDVRYNFDKDTDFTKFKTYEWVEIRGASKPDDLTDKQIKAAVDAQLAQKGLAKVTDKVTSTSPIRLRSARKSSSPPTIRAAGATDPAGTAAGGTPPAE